MKAIAICGSPRIEGNTEILLLKVLEVLEAEGVPGELVRLEEMKVEPCVACGARARLSEAPQCEPCLGL